MIPRSFVILSLAAALAACNADNPTASSVAPAQGVTQAPSSTGDAKSGAAVTALQASVEFEGLVTYAFTTPQRGEGRFVIAGHRVMADRRTAIWVGSTPGTIANVTVGHRAQVKGEWVNGAPPSAVLAREIRMAGPGAPGVPTPGVPTVPGGPQASCAAPGARLEIEGTITARGASDITVFQQGKGTYLCQVGRGTSIRKGNRGYTLAQLQPGWRVHVKGEALASRGGVCQVNAREIKVQNTRG